MEKKITNCRLMIAFAFVLAMFTNIDANAQCFRKTGDALNRFSPAFDSKEKIMEWARKEFGDGITDTISLQAEATDIFAFSWNYASGDARQLDRSSTVLW